ncbi:MAG: hypothetical protein ACI87E_002980 [Mariniblastus sp.]
MVKAKARFSTQGNTVSTNEFYDLICAKECRNTHHKLVMNSLKHLNCANADKWRSLFIKHFELYLQGSKAPDTTFKDFRNHVLHVSDNFWGGPVKQAEKWYGVTIENLKNQKWSAAAYSAGVLSHYYMDPLMPLHTGQTEEEGVIHRACEWSVNKSFTDLIELLETSSGYPTVQLSGGDDWLKTAIHDGATLAHGHYHTFIDHYNIELGAKNPPAGLDDPLRQITAQLLGHASVGFARILERAFVESGAIPAGQTNPLTKLFYRMTTPVSWVYKGFQAITNRSSVKKIAAEYRSKGKVIKSLPRDEKLIRAQHAEEILKIDLAELDARPITPVGSKSESTPSIPQTAPQPARRKRPQTVAPNKTFTYRLSLADDLEAAPSIGKKTAVRFSDIGIETVQEFLDCEPEETAFALNASHIVDDTIRLWQTQAKLACQIPQIYGHDAQILAACGFESPQEIAQAEPEVILSLVDDFSKTRESEFILRSSQPPNMEEVTNWIQWSKESRQLKAA